MALASLTALAAPSAGTHDGDCSPGSSVPELALEGHAVFTERIEVSVYGIGSDTASALIVYEETNGVDGIQRSDAFEEDQACGHGPDALVALTGCTGRAGFEPYDGGLLTPTCSADA